LHYAAVDACGEFSRGAAGGLRVPLQLGEEIGWEADAEEAGGECARWGEEG